MSLTEQELRDLQFLRRALRRDVERADLGHEHEPNDGDELLYIGKDNDFVVTFAVHPGFGTGMSLTHYRTEQSYRYDEPPDVVETELGFIRRKNWLYTLARMVLMHEAKWSIEDRLDALGETMVEEQYGEFAFREPAAAADTVYAY